MIDEAVRLAQPTDGLSLADLERDARTLLVEQRGGPALLAEQPAVGDWAAAMLEDHRAVFVGTLDGTVFGYLELLLGEPAAVVRQVFVEPEARQLGLGDALLEAAVEVARAAGCETIEGTALPGDRDTKNLYERGGIVARKITVSKRL